MYSWGQRLRFSIEDTKVGVEAGKTVIEAAGFEMGGPGIGTKVGRVDFIIHVASWNKQVWEWELQNKMGELCYKEIW